MNWSCGFSRKASELADLVDVGDHTLYRTCGGFQVLPRQVPLEAGTPFVRR